MLVTCWCLINLVGFHFLQSKSSDSRFPLEPIINGLWRSLLPLYFQRNLRLASQQRVGLVGRASNLFPVSLQIYEKQNSFPNEWPWLGSNQSRFFLKIIHTFFLHLFGFFFPATAKAPSCTAWNFHFSRKKKTQQQHAAETIKWFSSAAPRNRQP